MRLTLALVSLGLFAFPATVSAQKAPKKERNRISQEELVQAAERYTVGGAGPGGRALHGPL